MSDRPSLAGPNAATLAAKNLDREVGRPKHRRAVKCTASPKTDGHFGGQTKSAQSIFDTTTRIDKNVDFSESCHLNKNKNKASYPTIFCLIKTHPNNIKINKSLNVYRIWGHKCDNYTFTTLLPKHLRPKMTNRTIEVFENIRMIQPKGLKTEDHDNLTQKLYQSIIYVYNQFPSYQWYYIVDDDACVNLMNLKAFLQDKSSQKPITYGYNFRIIVKDGYHSGGPGYVLSQTAFQLIAKTLINDIKNCPDTGIDDVDINKCLRINKGMIGKSIDEQKRERFLVFDIMTHYSGKYPKWIDTYSENRARGGLGCCSDQLIAVHKMGPRDCLRLQVAFQQAKNLVDSYNFFTGSNQVVTFENVIKNYIAIGDINLLTE
ncbi:glyco -N-acetylgalactosamine 3-beta-galactosyltransferase 1-like [Brachionus plicatilis]|uniref:Glyco-N-acetylgalactosamine 3-beta-galactosyltransferase 1-like n=1 Tax=Brachionus plicatilis TaxID=10195 RepID=A0A3M7SYF2_BRAPC|nr:glyco -N-acetylgalactosamine 3-beta-galactosyltransferase 1-like [Brachionus plicatilis]